MAIKYECDRCKKQQSEQTNMVVLTGVYLGRSSPFATTELKVDLCLTCFSDIKSNITEF